MDDATFEHWLVGLAGQPGQTPAVRSVLRIVATDPARSSYASAASIAILAGVATPNVTRAAQALGYPGWSSFRDELRGRYLESLLRLDAGDKSSRRTHGAVESSYRSDLQAIESVMKLAGQKEINPVVSALERAERRWILATTPYIPVAETLALELGGAGLPATVAAESGALVWMLGVIKPGDVVMVFAWWRTPDSLVAAAELAAAEGSTICVISNPAPTRLLQLADHVLPLSPKGEGRFPSAVPALAVANAIATELSARDPEGTKRAFERMEAGWNAVRVPVTRPRL